MIARPPAVVGDGDYEGKMLARTLGGRDEWWEPIGIAVHKSALKYPRHMRSGGTEEGAATRTEKEGQP